jgi:hypothetical protein
VRPVHLNAMLAVRNHGINGIACCTVSRD